MNFQTGFEKLRHFPGHLAGHADLKGCECAQGCVGCCSSVTQSCPTPCDPMDCGTPGLWKRSQSTSKGPKLSPLPDLDALHNQEVIAKTDLSTSWLSVEDEPLQGSLATNDRFFGYRNLRKSLSIH